MVAFACHIHFSSRRYQALDKLHSKSSCRLPRHRDRDASCAPTFDTESRSHAASRCGAPQEWNNSPCWNQTEPRCFAILVLQFVNCNSFPVFAPNFFAFVIIFASQMEGTVG